MTTRVRRLGGEAADASEGEAGDDAKEERTRETARGAEALRVVRDEAQDLASEFYHALIDFL